MGTLQAVDQISGTGLIPQPYGIIAQSIATIFLRVFKTQGPVTSLLPK